MPESMVVTAKPARFDGPTRGYLALAAAVMLVSLGVLTFVPEMVLDTRRAMYILGTAIFAVAGCFVLATGRIGPRSIHPLTLAALVGGNLMIFGVADDIARAVYAGWNVMIVMYLATSMTRRMVVFYGALGTGVAAVTVGLIAGDPTFVATRVAGALGLVSLPIASFLMLRGELDDALAAARELASRDSLTGLLNRRGMFDAFPVMALGTTRDADALAVLVCDLDHFKRINDTAGHAVGDDVLRQVGATLRASVREGDIVVRLGGEELCVIAAVDGAAGAHELAERLRRAVQRDCARWSATMSVGVALDRLDRAPGFSTRLEALLAEADRCLYEAKADGRNRVVGPTRMLAPSTPPSATPDP